MLGSGVGGAFAALVHVDDFPCYAAYSQAQPRPRGIITPSQIRSGSLRSDPIRPDLRRFVHIRSDPPGAALSRFKLSSAAGIRFDLARRDTIWPRGPIWPGFLG